MKLRIIYGKAGSGKSTYLFNYVKEIISNPQKIYIITPEQFSFTAEKKLLESTNGAAINAEVLTFSRMANRVIKETGSNLKNIQNFGKSMLIYDILDKEKKDLKFLGKNMQNVEIIEKTIKELKKHNITEEKLEQAIENTKEQYLKIKLKDIQKIYKKYQAKLAEKYLDENDTLTILAERIKNIDMFKNAVILIDEFAGFTPQEYKIIEKLMQIAKEINITMTLDKIEEDINKETDIFYSNKIAINKLINLAKLNKVQIEEPIKLNKQYRFKNEELKHLEENIYSNIYKKYKKENENIKLFLAANPYSEIEYVASKIIEEIRENGYRYRDIGIIAKNIENYSSLIKAIFGKYEIPVYIDEKKDLNQNILIKYIISILEVFAKNWSYDSVIAYAKTMFCDIEEKEIYAIENYAKKWGIKYSKWYKADWEIGEKEETLKKLNQTRRKIVIPLLKFKEKCIKDQSAKNITKAIYEFLIENEIDKKLQKKAETLKNINAEIEGEYKACFNTVVKILDEIVKIFGEEKITFEKYKDILKISFAENELGKIPLGIDQVTVGDVDRSRSHKVKIIYIIRHK